MSGRIESGGGLTSGGDQAAQNVQIDSAKLKVLGELMKKKSEMTDDEFTEQFNAALMAIKKELTSANLTLTSGASADKLQQTLAAFKALQADIQDPNKLGKLNSDLPAFLNLVQPKD